MSNVNLKLSFKIQINLVRHQLLNLAVSLTRHCKLQSKVFNSAAKVAFTKLVK
jgi:hypothetical protein